VLHCNVLFVINSTFVLFILFCLLYFILAAAFLCNYRCCQKLSYALPVVVGLSLFTKTKDKETDETNEKDHASRKLVDMKKHLLEDDSEVVLTLKKAKLAEAKQNLDEADELYHHALALVSIHHQQKSWSPERILQARVYIYDCMANLALVRGQRNSAEKLLKSTIQGLLQQGKAQDDNAIVELSLKLAVIYAAENRLQEAELGYQFCIDTQQKKVDSATEFDVDTVALLGMSVDAYSRYLVAQKDYSAAMRNLNKALEIAISVLGETHQQVAVLLSDIATVASLTNDFDIAQDKLLRAVDIAEKIESSHLPTMYYNLGAVYAHQQNVAEARALFNKAVKLAKQFDDKEALMKAEEGLNRLETKT